VRPLFYEDGPAKGYIRIITCREKKGGSERASLNRHRFEGDFFMVVVKKKELYDGRRVLALE